MSSKQKGIHLNKSEISEQASQAKKAEDEQDWRTKINWEKIYKTIVIGVLSVAPFFIYDIYKFRQYCDNNGLKYLSYPFAAWTIVSCLFLTVYRHYFADKLFYNFVYKNLNQKYEGIDREKRTKKVVRWGTDIIYYTTTTIFGCIFFSHKSWFPFYLDKDWYNQGFFEQWPQMLEDDTSTYVYLYLGFQFGQHIYSLLELIVLRRGTEDKFYEWLLHHTLAFTLILYSITQNFFLPGVAILMIHDVGDIFLLFTKLYGMFKTDLIFYTSAASLIVVWFLTRLYIFLKGLILPLMIAKTGLYSESATQEYQKHSEKSYIYMLVLCFLLVGMHAYWFAFILTLFFGLIKKRFISKTKNVEFQNEHDFQKKRK